MFYKFDDLEQCRLNRGVRGRLIEHCKYLLREKKLKGYEANEIYENTKTMPFESDQAQYNDSTVDMRDDQTEQVDEWHINSEDEGIGAESSEIVQPEQPESSESSDAAKQDKIHELPYLLRNYLEKIRYFN